MNASLPVSRVPPWLAFAGWLALTLCTGALGALASIDAQTFYAQQNRPSWAPPASVFGPVWTVLYVLMAVSAWLIWRARGWVGARRALGLFVVQLVFNALWSWVFFVWHRGALAVVDVLVLWILLLLTTIAFARIHPLASLLLAPYLAWVTFASALTIAVWRLNPSLL